MERTRQITMSPVTYHPSPNAVFTAMDDDEGVLLHLQTRAYFSLNETGTLIWKLVQQGKHVDAIASVLEQSYDVDHASALQQVESFLDELAQDGLVDKE